jgi:hypothetical protein
MADLFAALDCAKISPGFLVLFGLTPGEFVSGPPTGAL